MHWHQSVHKLVKRGKYVCLQVAVPVTLLQQEVAKLDPNAGKQIGYTGLAGGQVPSEKEYRPERYRLREQDAAAAVIAGMEDSLRQTPRSEP